MKTQERVQDRNHAAAIQNLADLNRRNADERAKLQAQFDQANAAYQEWLAPKKAYEKAKAVLETFEARDSADKNRAMTAIERAAHPRIDATIRALVFAAEQTRAKHNQTTHHSVTARCEAIAKAIEQLRALKFAPEPADVEATIREITAPIPQLEVF